MPTVFHYSLTNIVADPDSKYVHGGPKGVLRDGVTERDGDGAGQLGAAVPV